MDSDEAAYRKSVRNMSIVLAAIVITVFVAIFIPPYINPSREVFQDSVAYDSPFGFTMHLTLNYTTVSPKGGVVFAGWVNSSSDSIDNVTAEASWAFSQSGLWMKECVNGWPIGLGVMQGHYTQDNYTLGTLIELNQPASACTAATPPPQYLLFYPHSSMALVSSSGSPVIWVIQENLSFSQYSLRPNALPGVPGPSGLPPGVYTAVLADEWGDVLTANFQVS